MERRLRSQAQSKDNQPRARRHRPDYLILLCMGLLMMLGLVVMYAIGPQRAQVLNSAFGSDNYDSSYFFIKQLISLVMAITIFFIVYMTPFSLIRKHAKKLLIIAIFACILLTIGGFIGLGIVQCSLGACRWFDLGPLGSLQPAELLKLGLLLFVAVLLGSRYRTGDVDDRSMTLVPIGVLIIIAAVLVIFFQKDMGTGISILAIVATMLFVVGLDWKIGAMIIAAMLALGVMFILIAPHRLARIEAFVAGDQISTSDPETYHIAQAMIAIGSGGLFGLGIGDSVQATGYLPEAINDSVFAIMGETFGFVGLVIVISLFLTLLVRIIKVSDHLPDMTQRLVVAGVFGWMTAHVVLNIAAMTGVMPLTGITLPLLSFGGTSMVFVAAGLGLVFQLSQYTVSSNELATEGVGYENSRNRRRVRRTRNAYSGRTS